MFFFLQALEFFAGIHIKIQRRNRPKMSDDVLQILAFAQDSRA
jgi:hypothetical protein